MKPSQELVEVLLSKKDHILKIKNDAIMQVMIKHIFMQVARNEGISVEEVKENIQESINDALKNLSTPESKAFWSTYLEIGLEPSPEDFFLFMNDVCQQAMDMGLTDIKGSFS